MSENERKAFMEKQQQVEGKWKNPLGNNKFPEKNFVDLKGK